MSEPNRQPIDEFERRMAGMLNDLVWAEYERACRRLAHNANRDIEVRVVERCLGAELTNE